MSVHWAALDTGNGLLQFHPCAARGQLAPLEVEESVGFLNEGGRKAMCAKPSPKGLMESGCRKRRVRHRSNAAMNRQLH